MGRRVSSLLVLAVTVLVGWLLPLARSQPYACTNTSGLPSNIGQWNLTNWPTTNQFFPDPDASIIIANAPFQSMFGFNFPVGSFVMWGGSTSVLASSPADPPSFQYWRSLSTGTQYQAGVGNAQCAHRRNFFRLYVIGDSYSGNANTAAPYVFTSVNEWNWTSTLGAASLAAWTASPARPLLYTGCVVDIQDKVYSLGVSDIYSSVDNGTTWTRITPTVIYTARSAFAYGIFTGQSGADIMVVAGGLTPGNSLLNDVWASQTGGTTWIRITSTAPWSPRVGANLAIALNGVMVLHGGATGISPPSSTITYYSDAYISFDGSATWQLLIASTGVQRSLGAIVFDAQGYLYLFSGYNQGNVGAPDGWRSNYALGNLQQWGAGATATALTVPNGYSSCTPYFNLGAQQPGASTGGSSPAASTGAAAAAVATTCSAAGLPSNIGQWNLSNYAATNQFFPDPDASVIIANQPFSSMFGFSFPTGSFAMWGGSASVLGASSVDTPALTYWRSLSVATPYQAGVGNAQCAHRKSYFRLYVIGDSYNGNANTAAPYVFASLNEWNWTNVLGAATLSSWTASPARQLLYTGCVVDIQDKVYSLGVSDLWVSSDNGTTWVTITPQSKYSPRSAFSYGIFTGQSGADIMVVAGGLSTSNTLLNDVWASQNSANTWVRTTFTAPWAPRVGANLAIALNGVMVLQGGSTGIPAISAATYFGDAWISLDCAATWQLLIQSSVQRSMGAVVFDAVGYLYLFSGYNSAGAGAPDGWRSTLAIANLPSWGTGSTATALTVPAAFSPCTPYVNVGAQQAAPSSTGGTGQSGATVGVSQTCTTSGLPTGGQWNLSTYATTNQFFPDPDASIVVAQKPFTSMFGSLFPAGSFVMWGGSASVLGASPLDTPLLTYWRSLSVATPYQAGVGNAQCAHRRNFFRLYVIGDSYSGNANTAAPYVFTSLNEWNWTNVLGAASLATWTASPARPLLYTGCVVDINDRVYSLGTSDVYSSADNGTTWTRITPTVIYTARSAFSYGIFTGQSGTDIMVVAGGLSTGNGLLNDVWASQTSGQAWVQTTASAPWPPRLGANLAIFTNGVMVLQGGSTAIPATAAASATYYGDAWISLDGAQIWQQLIASSVQRTMGAVVFDASGFLYLYSGYNALGAGAPDGWRSTLALANLPSWTSNAATSPLSVPSSYSGCSPYFDLNSLTPSGGGGSTSSSSSSSGLSNGAIAGIVIGSVVGAVIFLVLLVLCLRASRGGSKGTSKSTYGSHRDTNEDSRAEGNHEQQGVEME